MPKEYISFNDVRVKYMHRESKCPVSGDDVGERIVTLQREITGLLVHRAIYLEPTIYGLLRQVLESEGYVFCTACKERSLELSFISAKGYIVSSNERSPQRFIEVPENY